MFVIMVFMKYVVFFLFLRLIILNVKKWVSLYLKYDLFFGNSILGFNLLFKIWFVKK